MSGVAVDIVLPCFNPGRSWHKELLSFHAGAKERYALRYIVVNDGSTSGQIPAEISLLQGNDVAVQLINLPKNMGKGYALRAGVAQTSSDFVVYTDIDFPFSNQSMLRVIETLVAGNHDVIAGFRGGAYYSNTSSWFRKGLSRAFRGFLKSILKMPVTDTQCGLKAFNRKGREKFLATTIHRYLFDFEFIYTSVKDRSVRIAAVPVELKEGVEFRSMRLRILTQEALNLLKILMKR